MAIAGEVAPLGSGPVVRDPDGSDRLRTAFSRALSAIYRREVAPYGDLLAIVRETNAGVAHPDASRLVEERHGAIRLGRPDELALVRRVFAVLGMFPVGYYDLAQAGIPVHSTAFRPVDAGSLAACPFRMFTSLLRLDAIEDRAVAEEAAEILSRRTILSARGEELLGRAERDGGLDDAQAKGFVEAAAAMFAWRGEAVVGEAAYRRLASAHPVVCDVVALPNPHLNHLTPRTLDIDAAHRAMAARGLEPKPTIEGPPRRAVPILLRQTSFLARSEAVRHGDARWTHTARFGEIEQRGAALTRRGRALYDECLASGEPDAFEAIPDDLERLAADGLGFVREGPTGPVAVTYEDFLPVSAAGIFRSNLGRGGTLAASGSARTAFEAALGAACADEFALYAMAG